MTQDHRTYRVALIGCGRKGHGHARGYAGNPSTEVVAAADPDADNLKIFLEHFPVPGYADYRELLAQEEIDIAAPILPVRPNPRVVIDCAEAGRQGRLLREAHGGEPGGGRRHGRPPANRGASPSPRATPTGTCPSTGR